MQRFFASIIDNPIFIRELRRRMRGKAMIFSTNAYIIFMCLVVAAVLLLRAAESALSGSASMADVGDSLFSAIVVVQTILVMMIAPTITSGMATAERERKTFDFLRVTTLSPFTFVMGALLSTMLYAMVVLVCALPLLCIAFLYGGIQISEVVLVFFLLTGLTLLLSCAGLVISSTRDRTKNAQGVTMALVILVGFFLYSQFSFSSLHNMKNSLAAPMTFFGSLTVPSWSILFLGTIFFSWLLLTVAARKLYIPENRPLAYRHSIGLFAVLAVAFMGWSWLQAPGARVALWMNGSTVFFFVIAVTHCLHQLEVGSEVWALKRTLPFFRVIDESPFFVVALLGAWAYLTHQWLTGIPGGTWGPTSSSSYTQEANEILAYSLLVFALFYLAMAASARFFAWRSPNRSVAFKRVITFWVVGGIVLPIIGAFWTSSGGGSHLPIAQGIVYLCPYPALKAPLNFLRGNYGINSDQAIESLMIAGGVLAVTAVVFIAAAVWQKSRSRHRVSYDVDILEQGAEY